MKGSGLVAMACLLAASVGGGSAVAAQPGLTPADWAAIRLPSAGPPHVIGTYTNGCIAGAATLPLDGPGFTVVHPERNRYYGHPETLDFLRGLAGRARAAGLGTITIGDIGMARGGPMPTGHASHEIGLDVDIWFDLDHPGLDRAARESYDLPSVVDPATHRVDPARWTARETELVHLAAVDPRVERIFVNPAIKLAMCEHVSGDRGWLRVVRPWFGHEAHFHVRLRCPADQPDCVAQEPPPQGDGCGAEVASWLVPPKPATPPATPSAPRARPPMPAACRSVISAP